MAEGGFATSRGSEYEYNNENGFRRRSASPLLFVLRLAAPHPPPPSRLLSHPPSPLFPLTSGGLYIYI